ncbi:MAG TPA: hypothetical protein PK351_02675 [Spirochaetota bacterium]|nr:hypothetical protein [Spirochaetota bacterium]
MRGKKFFVLIILIVSVLLMIIACSNILKWDNILENNWQEKVISENLGYIIPSSYLIPKVRVAEDGRIYIVYLKEENTFTKLHLASNKDDSLNEWEDKIIEDKAHLIGSSNPGIGLVIDSDNKPNVFYITDGTTGNIFFEWFKDDKLQKSCMVNIPYSDNIKYAIDNNDNPFAFYLYGTPSTFLYKLDFNKETTTDIASSATGFYILDYDVIFDKDNRLHWVYDNSNSYQDSIYYKNDTMVGPVEIRNLSDCTFNNFSLSIDNDKVVVGYYLISPSTKQLEFVEFPKDTIPSKFERGNIIRKFDTEISKSYIISKNGIIYSCSISKDDTPAKIIYNKLGHYERSFLTYMTSDFANPIDLFIDNKGYVYILYIKTGSTPYKLILLTNRISY